MLSERRAESDGGKGDETDGLLRAGAPPWMSTSSMISWLLLNVLLSVLVSAVVALLLVSGLSQPPHAILARPQDLITIITGSSTGPNTTALTEIPPDVSSPAASAAASPAARSAATARHSFDCASLNLSALLTSHTASPAAVLREAMGALDLFASSTLEPPSVDVSLSVTSALEQLGPAFHRRPQSRLHCLYMEQLDSAASQLLPISLSAQDAGSSASAQPLLIDDVLTAWENTAAQREVLRAHHGAAWTQELKAQAPKVINVDFFDVYVKWMLRTLKASPADYYQPHFLSHPLAATDRALIWVETRCTEEALFALRSTYLLLNVDRGLEVDLERRLAEEAERWAEQPEAAAGRNGTPRQRRHSSSLFEQLGAPWGLVLFIPSEAEQCYTEALDIRAGGLGEHIRVQLITSTDFGVACRLPLSLAYADAMPHNVELLLSLQADGCMVNSAASNERLWRRALRYGINGAPWTAKTGERAGGIGWNGGITLRRRSFLQRVNALMNCSWPEHPLHCAMSQRYPLFHWEKDNIPEHFACPEADDWWLADEVLQRAGALQSFFPPLEEAERFSVELAWRERPFFTHGAFKYHPVDWLARLYSASKVYYMRPHFVRQQIRALEDRAKDTARSDQSASSSPGHAQSNQSPR